MTDENINESNHESKPKSRRHRRLRETGEAQEPNAPPVNESLSGTYHAIRALSASEGVARGPVQAFGLRPGLAGVMIPTER